METSSVKIKTDVIKEMEGFVGETLHLLKPVEKCWQPADLLPALGQENWRDELEAFRRGARGVSDEVLAVLIGNMITEEALPSYETWLNGLAGIGGHGGTSDSPWALWTRGWTAEENRHGDVLRAYLYLSGRVDMHSIEVTTQYLIRNGFDPYTGPDPYQGLVYTSVQERATAISHVNTGKLAEGCSDNLLAKMCSRIASDEVRHERAYKLFFGKVIELDPSGALQAFEAMMEKKVVMPAQNMEDGKHNLFAQHVSIAQRMKVYTTRDYAKVVKHLIDFWHIPDLTHLSPEGAKAQEYLCGLPKRYFDRADRMETRIAKLSRTPCPWLFDRLI